MKNILLTKALQYRELSGFCVIPLKKDKTPLIPWDEFKGRKSSEEEIREWWTRWPNANIGVVTGSISSITIVDVDSHKGGDPKIFPKTYTVKTGNGGFQFYYQYSDSVITSNNGYSSMPHVDIRNDGGYAVAPPSVTDYLDKEGKRMGGLYEIVDSRPFEMFPVDLFTETKKRKKMSDRLAVQSGTRNSSMASIIGTILLPLPEERFLTDGWDAVVAINKTYQPPLIQSELKTTFESIANKERQRRASESKKNEDVDLLFGYSKDRKKIFFQNTENICRVLRGHSFFKQTLRFDIFRNSFEIKSPIWHQIEDSDVIGVQTNISILFPCFAKVGKDMVYDAIVKVSKENSYDSAIQYMSTLVWDKQSRLDTWLNSTYGAPDDKYHKAVGSNWIKGMVKRLVEPGCKFDFVLVLEGNQGVKKSTSLHILGGDWHVETAMSTDSKDFFMQFAGKSIIEFSEGETLSRTEVKRMKAIITMQYDRFRLPYERFTQDFPRRCVFAMTTNQTEYLKDETGNRRWLPVAVLLPQANIEWLKENREQLFAEAYYRITTLKETIYEFPEEETLLMQNARRIQDPNADLIANWYYNILDVPKRSEGITVYQVYRDALHGYQPSKPMGKWDEMSIADVLKNHLKLIKRNLMRDKARGIRWFNPEDETPVEEDVFASAFKSLES